MELFGIMFSVPVAFVTSAGYCLLVNKFVKTRPVLSRVFTSVSIVILVLWVAELIGVIVFGADNVNEAIGASYYYVHLALFLSCVPSLANILMLQRALPHVARWFIIAPVCTVLSLMAALLQYEVSETLFGID